MKFLKKILALVLVTTTILSMMSMSIASASAESMVEYTIHATTGGGNCTSVDIMEIKINGEKGSTDWHNVAALCYMPGTTDRSFEDIDVGKINSISVKNIGIDGWYPSKFFITSPSGDVTIFGGKWVDNSNEVTFSTTDNVVYFALCTSNEFGSGTDADVYMQFIDENGNETPKYNLTEIHFQNNTFEMNDVLKRYISLPSDFGKITKIRLSLDRTVFLPSDNWKIEYLYYCVKSGKHTGDSFRKNVNEWCSNNNPVTLDFT